MIVYAINPFGFAWLRRVNEHNVDLNRNFQDFAKPVPSCDDYDKIHDFLVPADWEGEKRKAADLQLAQFVAEHGQRRLQAIVSVGQHRHPDGLFFGGVEASWSNRTFQQILDDHRVAAAENLAVLDLHTGLGQLGYGEPIYLGPPERGLQRATEWFEPSVKSTEAGNSASTVVTGSVADGLQFLLPHVRQTYITLEFGTVSPMQVLNAPRADNWLYTGGHSNSPLAATIADQLRAAFYVDTPWWKAAVYGRFPDFVLRAYRGLRTV